MPERIYLTGFMGCGKSTIGTILSNVLGYMFLDLDVEVEKHIRMDIPTYFTQFGEKAFRRVESEALFKTATLKHHVIGLGGGSLVQPENLKWVLRNGLVVYLALSAEELTERLRYSTHRPLLLDENGQVVSRTVLYKRISEILAVRKPFYEQAHIKINIAKQQVGESVDAVARAVHHYRIPPNKLNPNSLK
ncbi:MAG: shikimate kinase [Bacteroidetes Order II. Incertae sedis bacterium]|nr:shikimate kinase [Bacteroidetes Order II. bacterium]